MLSILCRKDLVTFALVKLFQKGDFYAFTRNYWFSVMKIKNNYKKFEVIAKYRYEKKNYQAIITLWLKVNIVNYYCKIFQSMQYYYNIYLPDDWVITEF